MVKCELMEHQCLQTILVSRYKSNILWQIQVASYKEGYCVVTYRIAGIFVGLKFHGCSCSCITEIIHRSIFCRTRPVPIGDVVSHYYIYSQVYIYSVEGSQLRKPRIIIPRAKYLLYSIHPLHSEWLMIMKLTRNSGEELSKMLLYM